VGSNFQIELMSFLGKLFGKEEKESLDQGLQKTKEGFFAKITKAIAGKSTVDEEVLDNLEEALVSADVGIETTIRIIEQIEKRVKEDKYVSTDELNRILQEEIEAMLVDAPEQSYKDFTIPPGKKPYVILVVGVNGVGKTTTIGKLAHNYKKAGNQVILGAADTFRAAAVDQLTIWSERVGVPIVKQAMGSDPSAVAYDTVASAVAKHADVVIIDTAGRLHNKLHLMDELGKIKRAVQKVIPEAPHEVMLVLDGSTGQNALEQAKQFTATTDVSAISITKLDGTAKGGVVLAIANQFKIPVKYIGVGEKIDDLIIFDKHEFVDSLFSLK
jgi:fused signal recognition particle receptor